MFDFVRKHKILSATIIVVGCVVYYYIDPSKYLFIPKCPIKLITGFDCPGCGFQRALHATLNGDIVEAIQYNLFLVIAIPLTLIWLVIYFIIDRIEELQKKWLLINLNRCLIYFYVLSYFVWFIFRNIQNNA